MVLIGEFGLSIPYLMETVWLFSGYSFASGNIAIEHLFLFGTVGIIGRIAGASALFYISWHGKRPLGVFALRYLGAAAARVTGAFRPLQRLVAALGSAMRWALARVLQSAGSKVSDGRTLVLFGRSLRLSPFTVALGRLLWMRLPLTITLGVRKQPRSLLLGVVIFSVIWDGAYIVFGILGGRGGLEPLQMVLYPVGAMTLISATAFGYRRLRGSPARDCPPA